MAETPLLWRGEMTTRRALTGRGLGFLSPGMLWLIGLIGFLVMVWFTVKAILGLLRLLDGRTP